VGHYQRDILPRTFSPACIGHSPDILPGRYRTFPRTFFDRHVPKLSEYFFLCRLLTPSPFSCRHFSKRLSVIKYQVVTLRGSKKDTNPSRRSESFVAGASSPSNACPLAPLRSFLSIRRPFVRLVIGPPCPSRLFRRHYRALNPPDTVPAQRAVKTVLGERSARSAYTARTATCQRRVRLPGDHGRSLHPDCMLQHHHPLAFNHKCK